MIELQNIWYLKSDICFCYFFWLLLSKVWFLERRLGNRLFAQPNLGSLKCFLISEGPTFLDVLQIVRQQVYQICYTRYQFSFYVWWIRHYRKHCKVPEWYDQLWWQRFNTRCTSNGDSIFLKITVKTIVLSKDYQ